MTPEAQVAALAKAVGSDQFWLLKKHGLWWRPESSGYTSSLAEAGRYTYDEAYRRITKYTTHSQPDAVTMEPAPLPDYLNDLNAVHEVEKWAGENIKDFWTLYLDAGIGELPDVCERDDFPPECAPAPQRVEALVKTLKLWKE